MPRKPGTFRETVGLIGGTHFHNRGPSELPYMYVFPENFYNPPAINHGELESIAYFNNLAMQLTQRTSDIGTRTESAFLSKIDLLKAQIEVQKAKEVNFVAFLGEHGISINGEGRFQLTTEEQLAQLREELSKQPKYADLFNHDEFFHKGIQDTIQEFISKQLNDGKESLSANQFFLRLRKSSFYKKYLSEMLRDIDRYEKKFSPAEMRSLSKFAQYAATLASEGYTNNKQLIILGDKLRKLIEDNRETVKTLHVSKSKFNENKEISLKKLQESIQGSYEGFINNRLSSEQEPLIMETINRLQESIESIVTALWKLGGKKGRPRTAKGASPKKKINYEFTESVSIYLPDEAKESEKMMAELMRIKTHAGQIAGKADVYSEAFGGLSLKSYETDLKLHQGSYGSLINFLVQFDLPSDILSFLTNPEIMHVVFNLSAGGRLDMIQEGINLLSYALNAIAYVFIGDTTFARKLQTISHGKVSDYYFGDEKLANNVAIIGPSGAGRLVSSYLSDIFMMLTDIEKKAFDSEIAIALTAEATNDNKRKQPYHTDITFPEREGVTKGSLSNIAAKIYMKHI